MAKAKRKKTSTKGASKASSKTSHNAIKQKLILAGKILVQPRPGRFHPRPYLVPPAGRSGPVLHEGAQHRARRDHDAEHSHHRSRGQCRGRHRAAAQRGLYPFRDLQGPPGRQLRHPHAPDLCHGFVGDHAQPEDLFAARRAVLRGARQLCRHHQSHPQPRHGRGRRARARRRAGACCSRTTASSSPARRSRKP